ncbi:MAG: hypothetical protein IPL01_03165 [Acidobacteria bacterium]|nr:hypothetical protein [Acidobacteriota bacterium]
MFSLLAQITWKQWRVHRLRTLLTLMGIALGVAVFFAVRTANLTLISSLTLTIEKLAGKATLQITGGEAGFLKLSGIPSGTRREFESPSPSSKSSPTLLLRMKAISWSSVWICLATASCASISSMKRGLR